MDRARTAVAEIMQSENSLLAARTARANRYELTGFVVALLVSVFAIIGLAAQMLVMARANRQLARAVGEREAAESSQRESEAGYRAIFASSADLTIDCGVALKTILAAHNGKGGGSIGAVRHAAPEWCLSVPSRVRYRVEKRDGRKKGTDRSVHYETF